MKKKNDYSNLTKVEMADILGRSERTLTRWLSDGCPRSANGRYSAPAVIQWLIDRERASAEVECGGSDSPNLERLRAARADREELRRDSEKGDLISMEDVISQWKARLTAVMEGLNALAGKLPSMLDGRPGCEMYEIVGDAINYLKLVYFRDGTLTPRKCAQEFLDGVENWVNLPPGEQQKIIEKTNDEVGL